jgi:hypothetical protein
MVTLVETKAWSEVARRLLSGAIKPKSISEVSSLAIGLTCFDVQLCRDALARLRTLAVHGSAEVVDREIKRRQLGLPIHNRIERQESEPSPS